MSERVFGWGGVGGLVGVGGDDVGWDGSVLLIGGSGSCCDGGGVSLVSGCGGLFDNGGVYCCCCGCSV